MANFKTAMTAMAVAAAMTGSQALAADLSRAPGKPAGIRAAQNGKPSLLLIGGAAAVAVIAIVVATQTTSSAACGTACTPPVTTPSTTV